MCASARTEPSTARSVPAAGPNDCSRLEGPKRKEVEAPGLPDFGSRWMMADILRSQWLLGEADQGRGRLVEDDVLRLEEDVAEHGEGRAGRRLDAAEARCTETRQFSSRSEQMVKGGRGGKGKNSLPLPSSFGA